VPYTNPKGPSNQLYKTIGQTYYALPTNRNSRNTVGFHSQSLKGAAVWTIGQTSPSRGTGVNYFNVNDNSWGTNPNGRIESVRAGWGAHGFTEQGEIIVSHPSPLTTGMLILTRDQCGQGQWQETILPGPQYQLNPSTTVKTLLWPSMATSGNTVHMICVTEQSANVSNFIGYLNKSCVLLYYRSKDGGKTWDIQHKDFFQTGEMPESEVDKITGDCYSIAVRGNHVAIVYSNSFYNVCYLESKDGGNSWQRKVVYDNSDWDWDAPCSPRIAPSAATVYIDENHKVHIAFGAMTLVTRTDDTPPNYFTHYLNIHVGLVYWNDDQATLTSEDLGAEISGSYMNLNYYDYSGYIPCVSVVGYDEFYCDPYNVYAEFEFEQFKRNGKTTFPRILAKDGRVYLTYQSPIEYPFTYSSPIGDYFYRGIFITVSEDDGATWDAKNNTSWISYGQDFMFANWSNYPGPQYDSYGDPIFNLNTIQTLHLNENAYPVMSCNYKGDMFMLQWYNQSIPFIAANETPDMFQSTPINVITFTQDLKNIPAYKNIQEVYKGWWNGAEPNLEYPPQACEKPAELKAIRVEENVVLSWEKPEYITSTLLGYNVFRNGDKLNGTPITVTTYTDNNVPIEAYIYQVSAVYSNCESKKLGIKLSPELCEKPIEVSGVADKYDAIITWNEPENIDGVLTGYNVYRDGNKIGSTSSSVREYIDKDLEEGTYVFQVSAKYNHCPESVLTEGVTVVIFIPKYCEKPTDVVGTADENTAIITWKKPENIDGVLVNYVIYRNGDSIAEKLPDELTFMDENLEDGEYLYQIQAVYTHCKSELTESVKVILNINDLKTDTFKVYPNPTSGELQVQSSKFKIQQIEIFDISGKKVFEQKTTPTVLWSYDLTILQAGVYLIKIDTEENKTVTKRLVILK